MILHQLIDDGYTHEAYIAAVPGMHDAVACTFRPIPHHQQQRIALAVARCTTAAAATELLGNVIAAQVIRWNLPGEITAQELATLAPPLFDKLYAILTSQRASDPLPTTGHVPEAFREEADLHNLIDGAALLLLHPGAAAIDCDACARWIYDLETGQRQTIRTGANRREVPQPRPAGVPTPCASCPKRSPEHALALQLSAKNERTYRLWRHARATHFHCVPDHLKHDPILANNFAHLDDVARQVGQAQQACKGQP